MKGLRKALAKSASVTTRNELADCLGVLVDTIARCVVNPEAFYHKFFVPKKNGGQRLIEPSRGPLKHIQRATLPVMYKRLRFPSHLHGGVPKRSQITHAMPHVQRAMVATLDIRNFFGSVQCDRVERVFWEAGFRGQALTDLVSLTTLGGSLPQGAPTSCVLANLAILDVDRGILRLAQRCGLSYTRFVDDLALSSAERFENRRGLIVQLVKEHGFELPEEKIHFFDRSEEQLVTGLVVNNRLRPTMDFLRAISTELWDCLHNGAAVVAASRGVCVGQLKSELTGRVNHVVRVCPDRGRILKCRLFGVDWSRPQRSCGVHSVPVASVTGSW